MGMNNMDERTNIEKAAYEIVWAMIEDGIVESEIEGLALENKFQEILQKYFK